MSQLSNYLENALMNHIRGGAAFSQPAGLYLALYTTDPTDADSGTEVAGNGYARQAIALGAPTDGVSANTSALAFTASGGNWGSITHVGIRDAAAAGNLLWHGPMTAAKTINDGDTLDFAIGDVTAALT